MFADQLTPDSDAATASLAADLEVLSVDTACVPAQRGAAVQLLEGIGFREVGAVGSIVSACAADPDAGARDRPRSAGAAQVLVVALEDLGHRAVHDELAARAGTARGCRSA